MSNPYFGSLPRPVKDFDPEKVERFHKRHLLMPDKEMVVLASDYDKLLALYNAARG